MSKTKSSRFTDIALVIVTATITAIVLVVAFALSLNNLETSPQSEPTFLYVQTAHSGTLSPEQVDGKRTLVLNNVSPNTIYFSDRPDRITGHEPTEEFMAKWIVGENSFAVNPPNAALDIITENSQSIAIVELMTATYDAQDKTLKYEVIVLDDETDGHLPQAFEEAALFIDSTHKDYTCECELSAGQETCTCEYNYTLGKSATKEFRGYCGEGLKPTTINIFGKKKGTSCTTQMLWKYGPYVTRSCTNWSPVSRDGLNIIVHCKQKQEETKQKQDPIP